MDFKRPTLEELKEIQRKDRIIRDKLSEERERVNLAISLDICPECSSPIIRENIEVLDKPLRFLGIILMRKMKWDSRTVCSKNKAHYEHKENYDNYGY